MQALKAEVVARLVHRHQVDKNGAPYIEHVTRVVQLLGEVLDDVRAAAWLHDVVEDTGTSLDDLRIAGVSPAVVEAVDVLTRRDADYPAYIAHVVASGNAVALLVKRADLVDHLSHPGCPAHLETRYRVALRQIETALVGLVPPVEPAEWLIFEANTQTFWGPNRGGYFGLWGAGLYTEREAREIARYKDRRDQAHHISEYRDQINNMRGAWDRLNAVLEAADRRRETR